MAKAADYGLMIWDAKRTGTLSNVIEPLIWKKKSVVFVNTTKAFQTVGDFLEIEALVLCMAERDRLRADEKIQLRDGVNALKQAVVLA